MLYLDLPVSSYTGWGIVGKYLAREFAALEPTRLITEFYTPDDIGDELEYHRLVTLTMSAEELARVPEIYGKRTLSGPLLQPIRDKTFVGLHEFLRGRPTVGYAVLEETCLTEAWLENGRRNYDMLAAGSSWCAQILQQQGLDNVVTVIQGIDPDLFFPRPERKLLPDHFLVFSGGKLELRKGQDIVIRAYKVLQDRHADVVLTTAWHNTWERTWNTMAQSPYIRFEPGPGESRDPRSRIQKVLADNGIDLERVIIVGRRPNQSMGRIYRNTDVGLFPNRCEGGTNLVLMEYMACGKPVIAAATTGHADIVNPRNALLIQPRGEITVLQDDGPAAVWPAPDLDETIAHLEWAYQNRDKLASVGTCAGQDLAAFTWRRSALQLRQLLTSL
jgi:glycosyltransferase involved in cell wall biosynthesis